MPEAAETLGGPDAVQAMISRAQPDLDRRSPAVDADWVDGDRGEGAGGGGGTPFDLAELACPRRSATPRPGREIATDKVEQLVELLVAEVLQTRSIS